MLLKIKGTSLGRNQAENPVNAEAVRRNDALILKQEEALHSVVHKVFECSGHP